MLRSNQSTGRLTGFALLLVTVLGWGVAWPVFKQLLMAWPPLFARGVAGLLGASGLAAFAACSGRSLRVPWAVWPQLAVAAFFNVFVWMGFTSLSLRWLNVSEAALLTYTMPLWTMLLAWPLLGERPGPRDVLAVLLGFTGVVTLVAGPQLAIQPAKLPGVGLALAAAMLFALGTLRAKKPLPLDALAATAWQVALGCSAMLVLGLVLEPPRAFALSAGHAVALVYMAALPMAVCYVAWFGALRRLPASTATMGTLLVPVVGTAVAAWWLHEPLSAAICVAFGLILSGVALAVLRGPR